MVLKRGPFKISTLAQYTNFQFFIFFMILCFFKIQRCISLGGLEWISRDLATSIFGMTSYKFANVWCHGWDDLIPKSMDAQPAIGWSGRRLSVQVSNLQGPTVPSAGSVGRTTRLLSTWPLEVTQEGWHHRLSYDVMKQVAYSIFFTYSALYNVHMQLK